MFDRIYSVKDLEEEFRTWDGEKLLNQYRAAIFSLTKKNEEGGWKQVTIMYREILRRLKEGEQIDD